MKVFSILKKIVLILSFVLFGVAFVLAGITLDGPDQKYAAGMISFVLLSMIGFFLFFAENKIAKRIGYGLTTGAMVIELYFAICLIGQSTSAILGLVSAILYVIYFLMALIGYLALGDENKNDPETDPKIRKVLGWKKLEEQGIISHEEFEAKRQEILGLKKNKEEK